MRNIFIDNNLRTTLKIFTFLNLLFLVYFFSISIFNIPTNDDWVFLNSLEHLGVFGFIKDSYQNWQGRFSYYLIISLFLKVYQLTGTTFYIILILVVAGVSSLYSLMTSVLEISKSYALILSLFLFNLSVFGSLDFNSFFWICASAYNILVDATILLVVLVIKGRTIFSKILIFVLSFFIGGGAEAFTCFVIFFLGGYLIYSYSKNRILNFSLIFSFIIMLLAFIIMIIAPGNHVRMQLYQQSNTFELIFNNSFKAFFQLVVYMLPKLLIYLLAGIPFIFLSAFIRFKFPVIEFKFSVFVITFFILVLFWYLSLLPGVYATSLLTPLRALSHLSYITILFFSFWGYVYGISIGRIHSYLIFYLLILCLSFNLSFLFYMDLPRMVEYKESYENRKLLILTLKNSKRNFLEPVVLKPLTANQYCNFSCVVYSYFDKLANGSNVHSFKYFPVLIDEITSNKSDFRNIALKNHLSLRSDIILDTLILK